MHAPAQSCRVGKDAQARSDPQSPPIVRAACPRVGSEREYGPHAWARRARRLRLWLGLGWRAFAHPLMSFVKLGGATTLPLHKRARSCWYDDRATVGAKP